MTFFIVATFVALWVVIAVILRSSVFRQRRETDGSLAANRSLDLRR